MRRMPLLSAVLLVGTTAAVCALFRVSEGMDMTPLPIPCGSLDGVYPMAADKHEEGSWLHARDSQKHGLQSEHHNPNSTIVKPYHDGTTYWHKPFHTADTYWHNP